MSSSFGWLRLAAAALALAACERASGPGSVTRRPAVLEHHGERSKLEAPAKAKVGKPFDVRFVLYGSGCLGAAPAETELHERGVEIRAYQEERLPLEGAACAMSLRLDEQKVTVAFPLPGRVELKVLGRAEPSGAPVALSRFVEVAR